MKELSLHTINEIQERNAAALKMAGCIANTDEDWPHAPSEIFTHNRKGQVPHLNILLVYHWHSPSLPPHVP